MLWGEKEQSRDLHSSQEPRVGDNIRRVPRRQLLLARCRAAGHQHLTCDQLQTCARQNRPADLVLPRFATSGQQHSTAATHTNRAKNHDRVWLPCRVRVRVRVGVRVIKVRAYHLLWRAGVTASKIENLQKQLLRHADLPAQTW